MTFWNTLLCLINSGSCPGVHQTWAESMANTIVFPQKQIASLLVPPLLLHLPSSSAVMLSGPFITLKTRKKNHISFAKWISVQIQLWILVSITSPWALVAPAPCNLSQYLFHTYESTQMANYVSDCTELWCIIRDGSKFLSWEQSGLILLGLWIYGIGEGSWRGPYLYTWCFCIGVLGVIHAVHVSRG